MISTLVALVIAAGPAAPLDVPLPPGELRGQVIGPKGAPVTRFTVNGVVFQHLEGRFKVLTPPQGEFRVVVRADGYAPNVFHVQGASGKKLQIPEIRLGAGEHVLGEVLDAETGMPVADARVSLADPAKLERLRFVRPERVAPLGVSGAGGWYELRRTPRGLLVLVVSAPGYLPEFVQVNTRDPLPTVLLHRGGAIAGSVRDGLGKPLPRARVVALRGSRTTGRRGSPTTIGRFSFERLRPGRYRVVALANGRTADAGEVDVRDGEVTEVSLRLAAPPPAAVSVSLAAR